MKQIVLQSNKENLNRAEELIYDVCDEFHVQNYIGVISVAVMEAVENAMHHGNHYDANKKVSLSWGNCKGGLYFEVSDQGAGFDFSQFGDLSLPEQSGDGIFLMKSLSDNLVFSQDGRCVRMEFMIEGIDSSEQMERCATLDNFFQSVLIHA